MRTMDRKMALRRHGVDEQRARTRLRVLIGLVAVIVLAAAGFWLLRSPLLAVDRIVVDGAQQSQPEVIIEQLGIAPGVPITSVDAAALESALVADPWIADARVIVTWPGTVEVDVTEYVAVAVVQGPQGFAQVTAGGIVVQLLDDATGWATIVVPDPENVRVGATLTGSSLAGALEFIAGLPADVQSPTIVVIDDEDQLTATLGEYRVRMGRAVEMSSKAAALVAVMESGVEPGSFIDVTAPRRPAVAPPQVEVEG